MLSFVQGRKLPENLILEEYLRTKTGYIQQWQTPVEGNSNKEKKS
jgi:hypothetical protein